MQHQLRNRHTSRAPACAARSDVTKRSHQRLMASSSGTSPRSPHCRATKCTKRSRSHCPRRAYRSSDRGSQHVADRCFREAKKGEIAATVLIAGKPARSIQRLSPEDGLHLLPIPYSRALAADYLPASLSHEDYPNMVSAGQDIDTVAVGSVLIAYNWPKNTDRYRRVQQFVEAFFPRIADFRDPPRHRKWREVTLAATLEGWDRFEPPQVWVEANKSQQASSVPVSSSGPQPTNDPRTPPAVDPLLFQQFLEWRRSTGK
jgi:hypothetical protein